MYRVCYCSGLGDLWWDASLQIYQAPGADGTPVTRCTADSDFKHDLGRFSVNGPTGYNADGLTGRQISVEVRSHHFQLT